MSPWRASGLAVLSGVLLALSFPKFGAWPVAWAALVPLLVAIGMRRGHGGARLAFLTGTIAALGTLYWTALVAIQYGGVPRPVAAMATVLLCLAYASFHAAFGWLLGRAIALGGTAALLAAPVLWVGAEAARSHLLLRFPWCLLGYSQSDNLAILQVASLGGVLALSFLIVLVAASVALVVTWRERRTAAWTIVAAVAAAWGGLYLWGADRLDHPIAGVSTIRVGIVQAAIPQDEKWDPAQAWQNVGAHIRLAREASQAGARLVVWPESAVPFYFDWSPQLAEELRSLTRRESILLLFGNDDREAGGAEARVFVGAKLLGPEGRIRARYHKMHLVPFGEYVPMQGLLGALGVQRLVREVGSFTPGTDVVLPDADGVKLGVSICYEAIFPELARTFVSNGADVLVNVTNDAWYGWTSAPYQHFAMARLRAVENGRYFVRAANTGISAMIDPYGRVQGATKLFEATTLVGDVQVMRGLTPYARYGDVLGQGSMLASGLFALFAVLEALRTWSRRRSGGDPVQ